MRPSWRNRRSRFARAVHGLRYRCGEYALRGFITAAPLIPFVVLVHLTNLLAWATFNLLTGYRNRMEANLTAALGREIRSPEERRAIVWRAWKNFARGVLDTIAMMRFSKERLVSSVSVDGEEHLKRALAQGRGVLALSAHLGSFTMLGGRLAAGGYSFSVVVKHPKDSRFAELINEYRAQLGIHTISAKPRREAVRGILKALRENRIVMMIADEFKSGDVMVDFLGLKAPAPRGPATLALRTGAVTLPMFATRQADESVIVNIGPAIEPVQKPDLEESVTATTALYTQCLEAAVRRYPDQWNWLGLPRGDRISRQEMHRQIIARRGPARRRQRAPAQPPSPPETTRVPNKEAL